MFKMKNAIIIGLLFLGVFVFNVTAVSAETVLRVSDTVTIKTDETIANDLYIAGNTIYVSGNVDGDAYLAGNVITSNGNVSNDLTAFASRVQAGGVVGDDLRVLAGSVDISGQVEGDLFVLAGVLNILPTAEIKGNVFFFGDKANISGLVEGSVMGSYSTLRIDSKVSGDVDVKVAGKFELGSNTEINGNLKYVSPTDVIRSADTSIGGEVIHTKQTKSENDTPYKTVLILFLMILFGSLTVYLFARSKLAVFSTKYCTPIGTRGLFGLVVVPSLLLLSPLLMITALGLWLGILTLLFGLMLIIISFLLSPIVIGVWISKILFKKNQLNTLTVVNGALAVLLLLAIPLVGPLVLLMVVFVISGGLLNVLHKLWFERG